LVEQNVEGGGKRRAGLPELSITLAELGVGLQVVRDWVMKFNADGPGGLIDRKAPGQLPRLNDWHRAALAAILESGPIPAVHGWCAGGLLISANGFSRNFVSPSPSRLSAERCTRWVIASSPAAPAIMPRRPALSRILKKPPHAPGRDRAREGPSAIELWFADESRVGQKNKITRRWAKRGSRPSAPSDQRTIFGAICPKEGKGAALVMPRCDTEAMNLHLAEIATQIAPGAYAAILVDQAGWHLSGGLNLPSNITLIALPAKCPKLNPQENIWQFMCENWLSNRIFKSFDDIVDHCCDAWNKLIDQPWRIMSIGMRGRALRF
jgi:hypothetical protein